MERQKPINLFLTIKKQIFEDLKNASDDFSNKLLNKLFGNEDNEEQNQKDYQANIREKDINIIKFKSPHNLKKNDKHNEEQLRNFIKLILFFIIIEAYIMYKYFYAKEYIDSVKKFLDVFNITLYSYIDITTNIDISKSFPNLFSMIKPYLFLKYLIQIKTVSMSVHHFTIFFIICRIVLMK